MRHHIRDFIYRRLILAIFACGIASGAGVLLCGILLFQGDVSSSAQTALQDAKDRFSIFDLLISRVEEDTRSSGRKALAELYRRYPNLESASAAGMPALRIAAAELGVSEVYFIDQAGIVRATSFAPDFELDLFSFNGEFTGFLKSMYESGRYADQRISASTQTGVVNSYQYFAPANTRMIIEVSTKFSEAVPRVYPGYDFEGLGKLVFRPLDQDSQPAVRFFDLISKSGPGGLFSMIHSGPLDPRIERFALASLESGRELEISSGFSLFKSRNVGFALRNFDFVDKPGFAIFEYNLRPLRNFIVVSAVVALVVGAGISGFSFLVVRFSLERRFTRRLVALETMMAGIGSGKEEEADLDDGGDDEISSIGRSAEKMVAELHVRAEESVRIAHVDPITGLPNRRAFLEESAALISLLERMGEDHPIAIVFMDLDHFKLVNDSYGHGAGDELLREIGSRIRKNLRDSDKVFRIGGDEFLILLSFLRKEEDVAEVLGKLRAEISRSVDIPGGATKVTASFGIALYPRDGRDPGELLRVADSALYEAKRERDGWAFHTQELGERVRRRSELAELINADPDFSGFRLVLQPIVTVEGRLWSFEALSRWRRPDGSEIPPAEFIPIMEDFGHIIRFGSWCMGAAAAAARELASSGCRARIAVNLSTIQLLDSVHIDEIATRTVAGELDPMRIYFEVTESCFAQENLVEPALNKLAALGYGISLDDFGSGYSSLGRLGSLHFDTLKIDRSLLLPTAGTQSRDEILRGIKSLGAGYGVDIIVEGVEDEELAGRLAELGFRYFQGYKFSRPLEIADALDFAKASGCDPEVP